MNVFDVHAENNTSRRHVMLRSTLYALAGIVFGVVLVKGEIASWFRVQEMFRFQAFHMYGVIGTAVATGITSIWLLRRFRARTISGDTVSIVPKQFRPAHIVGGVLFGIGWAMTGACPGPIYAQIGAGYGAAVIILAAALTGTGIAGLVMNGQPVRSSARTLSETELTRESRNEAEAEKARRTEELQEC